MARLITRLTALCRLDRLYRLQRSGESLLSRRFRMMRLDADDEDGGPGWYDSSRELRHGLQVREGEPGDALLAEWLAESRRPVAVPATPA